jgi:hypothetical protein
MTATFVPNIRFGGSICAEAPRLAIDHFFAPLKQFMGGRRLPNNHEAEMTHERLRKQEPDF